MLLIYGQFLLKALEPTAAFGIILLSIKIKEYIALNNHHIELSTTFASISIACNFISFVISNSSLFVLIKICITRSNLHQ